MFGATHRRVSLPGVCPPAVREEEHPETYPGIRPRPLDMWRLRLEGEGVIHLQLRQILRPD